MNAKLQVLLRRVDRSFIVTLAQHLIERADRCGDDDRDARPLRFRSLRHAEGCRELLRRVRRYLSRHKRRALPLLEVLEDETETQLLRLRAQRTRVEQLGPCASELTP